MVGEVFDIPSSHLSPSLSPETLSNSPLSLRNPPVNGTRAEPLLHEIQSANSEHFPPLPNLQHLKKNPPPPLRDSNAWKSPPIQGPAKPKKFLLRFIPPSSRGSSRVGICSSEAVAGELQVLDNTLVGFFLGKKPSFSYVRSSLLKQWKLQGSVQMLQLNNGGLAFRFSNLEDRDAILEAGVFYIGGQPLFLRNWERSLHFGGILGLKRIPLWITLSGLPLHLWGEESLSVACSLLGKPLFTDRVTAEKSRWAFARACVEFSADAPLLESITLEDDVGNVYEQPVKYDWRPSHCISCGIFGHIQESCPMKNLSVEADVRTSSTKPLQEEMPKRVGEAAVQGVKVGPDLETVGETISQGRPSSKDHPLKAGPPLSSLLQTKSLKFQLLGWNPRRVRKKLISGLDPTRSGNLSAPLTRAEDGMAQSLVSAEEVPQSDPNSKVVDRVETEQDPSLSTPCCRQDILNFCPSVEEDLTLSNRFGSLEHDVESSSGAHLVDPSFSTSSQYQPTVGQLNQDSNLERTPSLGPLVDQTSRVLSTLPLDNLNQTSPFPSPLSIRNLKSASKPVNRSSTPKASSAGRTPFPPKPSSSISHSMGSIEHRLPPLNRKKVKAITSVDLEKMMAPRTTDPWYEADQDRDTTISSLYPQGVGPWDELEYEE